MKRSGEEASAGHAHKKQKHDHAHRKHRDFSGHSSSYQGPFSSKHEDQSHTKQQRRSANQHYEDAIAKLPPATSKSGDVPAYVHFTVPKGFPALPPIQEESLASAPFTHKSTMKHHRSVSSEPDVSYERLEFMGDAYIELIASRLIFERFKPLQAGQLSQLRELLVKNETLAEYSRAYGFEQRVQVGSMEAMTKEGKLQGNKGFNKVLGDVFEAYVAAVVLSDTKHGYAEAEKWLTALWAPKLEEAAKNDKSYAYNPGLSITHSEEAGSAELLKIYNPTAKQELQRRILGRQGSDIRLLYEPYKDTVELKGDQLGQNKHFIALYLTGYGYERKLLGKGEGKNKVEAGNWAATEAMHGECKEIVEECERKLAMMKEEKKAQKKAETSGE